MERIENVVIIGSGPAGLTAAIYAGRGGLHPLVITGDTPGGQPTIATDIEDFPGFPEGIKGPEIARLFRQQAEKFNVKFLNSEVLGVNFKKHPFEIQIKDQLILAKSVILAVGSSPRWLGLPSEQKLIGRGVSVCVTCDGPFFKGKRVVVVGGGDSAMKEAYYISKIADQVVIIHRRDKLRAQEALQKQVHSRPNIKIIYNSVVKEVLGENIVSGVLIEDVKTGKQSKIDIEGVFIAAGHQPATGFLEGKVKLDKLGYIILKGETKTSVPGVFAAGDAADFRYRQVITAAASGCKAALDVEEYLDTL